MGCEGPDGFARFGDLPSLQIIERLLQIDPHTLIALHPPTITWMCFAYVNQTCWLYLYNARTVSQCSLNGFEKARK